MRDGWNVKKDREKWEKKGQTLSYLATEGEQEHRRSNMVSEPLVRHRYYVLHFELGLN